MEPMGPQLIVPNEIEKGDTHGTRNFIVAAWRADPGHHHTSSRIPSLRFGSLPKLRRRWGHPIAGIHRISSAIHARRDTYEFHYARHFHSRDRNSNHYLVVYR